MPHLYVERLRAQLGERYSHHTVRAFTGQSERFLAEVGVKPSYSKAEVLGYVDSLVRANYKASSISTITAGIRALFDANGLPWPLSRRDLHLGLPQDDEGGPVLPAPVVRALIAGAKRVRGNVGAAAALATVYGLRSIEIARAIEAGCNGAVLSVQTAKGGRLREHSIPPDLAIYLTCRATPVTTETLHRLFDQLMNAHVRAPVVGEGWHAVRRSLVTGLYEAGVPEHVTHRFMGWRSAKSIGQRYYRPTQLAIDEEVYAAHPFLAAWR